MAEIEQVFEDIGDNAKKLVKSKPFKVAAVCVAGVALYVALTRNQEEDATGYGAIGYAGYPTTGGGGDDMGIDYSSGSEGFDSSYFEQIISEMQNQQQQNADYWQGVYGQTTDELYGTIDALSVELRSAKDTVAEQQYYMERQNAISQMRANSELYNTITDRATKDALHAENLAIAEQYGFRFDASTGNYFDGNSVVYTTAKQVAGYNTAYTGGKVTGNTGGSNGTFQNNVDYQAEINKAIMNGASATVIDSLNAQRNAKIAASGGTAGSGGYDKNVDYSTLIAKAKASGASQEVIKNLETQRQNKINDVYGGYDPATTKVTKSTGGTTITKTDPATGKTTLYSVASDGKPIQYTSGITTNKKITQDDGTTKNITVKPSSKQPSMARDISRAGTTITTGGYKITYNSDGYATKKVKI